ncbi:ABC transporter ATP-binding protein [Paraburkholderia sp. BL25I1N1]|uniref:ABC transporter ATP-binding protein n=1 Tax=Paraburkholderia sp. BL25I1N1 TaxID=1938804 RepID=UPI000D057B4A|nr:ABC transporter ATP-binding protein [Paraburkholderia sp. BL25I1N1]PRY09162.1 lipopolysaccharide transport system ATP-binding protein [Paraburkholderia sp. BL25I1N1]
MYSEPTITAMQRPDGEVAIHIEDLSKRFGVYHSPLERLKHIVSPRRTKGFSEFWALSHVDLTIARGETCAIIGRNGSGKSTLLQILCGTSRGTSGRVAVNGRVAALLELGAGFNTDFTGRENVYVNGAVLGLSHAEIDERFADIEAFAEIGDFIDQPVKTYSSGMYVRLAFAIAIHVDPQILIVDEALAVGDARFQAKCLNRIKKMQADGVTLLFVSHDIGAVRTLCERALWLDQGKVRMLADAFSVTAQYSQFLFEGADGAADLTGIESRQEPSVEGKSEASQHVLEPTSFREPVQPHTNVSSDELMLAKRPINHWGSHIGSIIEAGIYNCRGERASVFLDRELIEVRVKFCPPLNADLSTMSVAFSLKDLRGTDLIVSTTWDQRRLNFDQAGGAACVTFRFQNRLNKGSYLLAVALEDRAGVTPQYYEYIEGAQYFASFVEENVFGSFLVDVEQTLKPSRNAHSEKRAFV